MIKRINFKKIKLSLKKLPIFFVERFFLTLAILVSLALVLGALVFYKFCLPPEIEEPFLVETEPLQFKEELCQEFLKILKEREEKFEEAQIKNYPDLFKSVQLIIEIPGELIP